MPIKKRTVVLIKTETTPNFDANPVEGTDAILMEDVAISQADTAMHERSPVGAAIGKAKSVWGGGLYQLSAKIKLKGSGVAATPPEYAPVLKAASLAETVGGSDVQYATSSTEANAKHVTIYCNLDGLQYIITGALVADIGGDLDGTGMVNVTLVGHGFEWGAATAGAASTITLAAGHAAVDDLYNGRTITITSGTGEGDTRTISDYVGATKVATVSVAWTTAPDATSRYRINNCPLDVALPSPTYDSIVEPAYIAAPFSYGSDNPIISKVSFSLGLELAKPKDVGSPDGFGTLRIVGRSVSGSFDPESTSVATMNWEEAQRLRTEQTIDTGKIGSSGNQYQLQFLRSAIGDPGHTDKEGINAREISFESDGHTGDGEFVFTTS